MSAHLKGQVSTNFDEAAITATLSERSKCVEIAKWYAEAFRKKGLFNTARALDAAVAAMLKADDDLDDPASI